MGSALCGSWCVLEHNAVLDTYAVCPCALASRLYQCGCALILVHVQGIGFGMQRAP